MAFSYQNYTGDNSTTTFSIPFTYTATSEISVTVDGVAQTGLSFPSASQVTLTSAPASNTLVQVRRTTSLTSRAVDFASGSVLTEEDLDNSNIQVFHASQEANDVAGDSITLDATDKWEAGNKVIKNVATPVAGTDAANKAYVDTGANNAAASATAAANSATAAATSATNSANSATASANSATASASSATASAASESAASTSATNSANSATNSASSATSSANSATASASSATASAASAATATTQATNASTSASTASTQATNAATSATLSGDYANKVNGAVAGSEYSSKAWALGGTGVTDTAGSGAAKEWATDTTNQVDGTEYSAKEYAIGSQVGNTAGSAKQWAIGGGGSYATNTTVDGTNYSARYWAEQAAAAVDGFDDTYLGAKSSDPTVDNDGDALTAGDLYFSTTANKLRVYDGTNWNDAVADTTGFASAGFSIAMSIAL